MNAAELEELAPGAAPAPAAVAAAPALEKQKPTPGQEWAQVPAVFGQVLGRWFPALAEVYSDEANERWGDAFAKVAEARGWKVDEFFAWLGPWVPVALATEALITPTVLVIRARIAELKAAQAEKKAEEGAATRSASS